MAKKKQEAKLKEPVRIRFKQLANGNQSIYLDYYTGDVIRKENYVGGKRQYEFLKLYLIPEKTREDKAKNETTLALAKAIQSKRIVELQNDAHGFQNTNKSKANVIDYLVNMRNQSKERGSLNYEKTIGNTIRELKLFRGDYIAFRDIDKDFLSNFVDFLKQAKKASKYGLAKAGGVLSNNSVVAYYGVLRTALNKAFKEGIITINPTKEFNFADKVKAQDKLFTFMWGKTETREAEIINIRIFSFVRFRWLDEEDPKAYFEFKMNYNELTGDYMLEITDFTEPDEIDDQKKLWDLQIETLRRTCGM